jgi:hypothetical protein
MPTAPKPGSGPTAPDDKSDAREPDSTADKRSDSPAHPTDLGVNETDEDVNRRYGFSTIDTSDVDHSKAPVPDPEKVNQPSGSANPADPGPSNSTFASRSQANSGRTNTRVSGATSK